MGCKIFFVPLANNHNMLVGGLPRNAHLDLVIILDVVHLRATLTNKVTVQRLPRWEGRQRWFFADFHVDGSVCSPSLLLLLRSLIPRACFASYTTYAAISNGNCDGQATKQVSSHSDLAKAWQAVLEPESSGISLCLNDIEYLLEVVLFVKVHAQTDDMCFTETIRGALKFDFTPLAMCLSLPSSARFDRNRVR